jgi:hypothetical protein
MIAPHRILQTSAIALGLIIFAGIVVWEVLRVTAAPFLSITSPIDNLLTASHQITLEGRAAPGSGVTANGVDVPVSMDGRFKEDMDLRTGANVITIVASKKFAKPNIIYRRVVVTN